MAWSPQARKAAALARKRRAKRKPQFGVNHQGKRMTPAQRKKAGIKRTTYKGDSRGRKTKNGKNTWTRTETPMPSRRNARLNKKIAKTKARTKKRVEKHGKTLANNLYTDGKGNVYSNRKGVKAHAKGVKAYNKGQKRIAKLKAKKRKRR